MSSSEAETRLDASRRLYVAAADEYVDALMTRAAAELREAFPVVARLTFTVVGHGEDASVRVVSAVDISGCAVRADEVEDDMGTAVPYFINAHTVRPFTDMRFYELSLLTGAVSVEADQS